MQRVTDRVFVETGFRGSNNGFVVTSEGIVMIDAPQMPADAVTWREEIARHGTVKYLINTEPHGDHYNTNCFFDATVIAHEGTRRAILAASLVEGKEFIRAADPRSVPFLDRLVYVPPSITLSERLTLFMGDRTFQIISFPGHTAYQVAVYVPEEKIVFTSDNVFFKVQAWLHQSLPFEWLATLERMKELDFELMVPGHGEICRREYLDEMASFIADWIESVRRAIEFGLGLEEAQERISFLDRYPMGPGSEPMGPQVQRWNVARLYELLKK